MKIGYVLNTYPSPSHSFIRREIQALERRGLSIHRIAMRPFDGTLADPADKTEAEKTEYVLSRPKLAFIWSIFLAGLASPLGIWRAFLLALRQGWGSEAGLLKHLIYFLEACQVAVRARELELTRLHAHFGTNAATVAMLAREMGAPPYSFTVHGPEEFDKPEALGLGEKIRRANFTVAISSYGRSQLCRQVSLRHWPALQVVHCGIEPERFRDVPPIPPRAGRKLRLVAIGRMVEQKGHLILVEAFAELQRRGLPIELVLIGDGPLRPAIERAIRHEGLAGQIRLTGWLNEQQIRDELAAAQGMVLPSFAEGLPVVLMEAMVAARPVIATYIAGIPELVQPNVNGWLVPAGDVTALVDAMTQMHLSSDEQLQRMGRSARARALTRHDVNTEAAKLDALFSQRPRTQPD